MPPSVNPFVFTAIEFTSSADLTSNEYVESNCPAPEIFQTVATVKSERVGTLGATTTLSGLIGAVVGIEFGATTGIFALEPATHIFPALSAIRAVAILAAPCVSARRHFSMPSAPIAQIVESLSKTIDEPRICILVFAVMGVARLIATISFAATGFVTAPACCETNTSGRVKRAAARRFTIV